MDQVTNSSRIKPAGAEYVFAVPNLLTYARIIAVPAIAACLFVYAIFGGGFWLRWLALAIFIAAAITDLVDGWYARRFGQLSTLGRMLDPIADKLLVGTCLLMHRRRRHDQGLVAVGRDHHSVPRDSGLRHA